ncbi:MAG: nitrogenase component 1 [Halobacteriota archaeon]|jgi:nitrogenase molybdenum-iron protein alpha/beta subunit
MPTDACLDPYVRCALSGAAQTALGVSDSAVLAHAPQGCNYLVDGAFSWQDCDYAQTTTLCTKLCEDEIVHGGEELLARTILEAKELDISALFVLSACGPEIVGDDIVAVCEDMQPKVDFKIIPIECAGFRGSQYDGIDLALDAMLRTLAETRPTIPNSVCLVAPHANANPTWMADLAWVKDVLSRLGVQVVATLTHATPLSDLADVAAAEGVLQLSHDAGYRAVAYLADTFGVEPLCAELPLPIGMTNARRWLTSLGERFDAEPIAENMIADGERMVTETCRRRWPMARFFYRTPAAIVADATIGIPLVRFATEEMELTPALVALRSANLDAERLLERELNELGLAPQVVCGTDVYTTRRSLEAVRPRVVFGSTIERHASEGLDVPYIFEVVRPVRQFRLLNREYFGYRGILNLLECIQNEWSDRWRSTQRRYAARW